ncbi:MAG: hypothetical protein KGL39_00285 [Patescibacteria group bacterium]|nr:hypothetical protein [Patescibacteria group bacterium]
MTTKDRNQFIVEQRSLGRTYVEIAQELGISKQRIEQIIRQQNLIGQIQKRYYTTYDLAEMTGYSHVTVCRMIHQLGIIIKGRRKIIITKEQVIQIENMLRRFCKLCGKEFKSYGGQLYCHNPCTCPINQRPPLLATEKNTNGLTLEILHLLRDVDPGTTYVTFAWAKERAGLSVMQLTWLRLRGILAVKVTDRIHPGTKRPIYEYSLRHVESIRTYLLQKGEMKHENV